MSHIDYDVRDGIAFIQFNRPEVLNALDDSAITDLRAALHRLDEEPEAQVGIISGAGRAFSSGADVRQRQLRPTEELARLGGPQGRGTHLEDMVFRFVNWKPLIAACHGYVLGAALRIALQCELIVAAEGTKFQITEVPRGLNAGPFWSLLVDRGCTALATDVALTGRFWDAEEGLRRGAVDRLVPAGTHLEAATEIARDMMRNPPLALRAIVQVRRQRLERLETAARWEGPRNLYLSEDFRESAQAFVDKRDPVFKGR